MDGLIDIFKKREVKRIIIFALMIFVLYSVRSMINIILLTFIFTFLMDRLVEFTNKRVRIKRTFLVLLLYSIILGIMTFGIAKYLPIITSEITQLVNRITTFSASSHDIVLINYIENVISTDKITKYLEDGFSFLLKSFSDISKTSVQVLLSLILSLFFLLEKPRLKEFSGKFKNSKIAPFYYEIEFFGKKFTRTFGKVIEAQFIIAIVNTILSVLILIVLGFPQIIGLAIMIFFLGLIPVAGVIISLVPLTL